MSDVTRILSQIESSDPSAAEQLLPLVYDELRKLAAVRLAKEQPGQTLQATALVHVTFYNVETGAQEIRLRGLQRAPMAARRPDGRRVAFGVVETELQPDEVSIWSLKSGHRLLTLPIAGRLFDLAFSADGNRLLVSHYARDGGLAITTWDATPLEE